MLFIDVAAVVHGFDGNYLIFLVVGIDYTQWPGTETSTTLEFSLKKFACEWVGEQKVNFSFDFCFVFCANGFDVFGGG